ncbi:MAG: hypothetical protein JWS11_2380 [Cypionkella sp.]|nr:hypothetical protein [Cypionkella sp.]
MLRLSARSTRIRGAVVFIFVLPLLAFGLWLMWLVLARPFPEWLPDAIRPSSGLRIHGLDASSTDADRLRSLPGVASIFLLVFGLIGAAQGFIMLLLGRRSIALLAVMFLMAAMMIGFGWSVR